ncbi:helix-turn-helix transcriptional regulator [Streptomyces collinus]|uniref:helix-turn-helix domain-containing protein n=1 Tax=Streptomyces collinus TaxID=42684 RepID=UPI0034018C4B
MSDLDQLTLSLAGNVRHRRTERKLTLDALAARAGVSRGMIVQIEQARTNPSIGTVVKIGDALGVSITTLLDYAQGPAVRIIPAEQAVRLWHTESGSYNRLLAGTEAPGPLEMWDWQRTSPPRHGCRSGRWSGGGSPGGNEARPGSCRRARRDARD